MQFRKLMLLALAAMIALSVAFGQGLTGTISGIVKDPAGSVVPNAVVTAKNTGTNAEATAKTNEEGYYRISNLPPGNYGVICGIGWIPQNGRAGPVAHRSRQPTHRFRSPDRPGIRSRHVAESGVQVNTEDAQMGRSLVDIPSLPNISSGTGRNPLNLMGLQPGIVSTSGGPSYNGRAVFGKRPAGPGE